MDKITWEKLPPYEGPIHQGCLNCPSPTKTLKMNRRIAVGFGFAGITKNGEIIWHEPMCDEYDWRELPTLMTFENMARKEPDNDWRVIMDGPLHGEIYQRHDRNLWVMIDSNRGFA